MNDNRLSFFDIALKTVITHTITYFVMGLVALLFFDYGSKFADPNVRTLMRQIDDPLVMAGPLFQPIRGILFAIAFYLLRDVLFNKKNGWLVMWSVLVILGILSTFGPSPGSLEGLIYTTLPVWFQLAGLPEVIMQSLLFSGLLYYWVTHPGQRWLNWILGMIFLLTLVLPILGLMVEGSA